MRKTFVIVFTTLLFHEAEAAKLPPPTLHEPVTVRLVLVRQRELCPTGYAARGQVCRQVTAEIAAELMDDHPVSPPYQLVAHQRLALQLPEEFRQALVAAIDAGGYAILLVFDWGERIAAVVDLERDARALPNWRTRPKVFRIARRWYSHQNANTFDPSRAARWRVSLNGHEFFYFYVPTTNQ